MARKTERLKEEVMHNMAQHMDCRGGTCFWMGCMKLGSGVQLDPQIHQFPSAGTSSTAMYFCTTFFFYYLLNLVDFQSSQTAKAAHFACRCSALAASKPL